MNEVEERVARAIIMALNKIDAGVSWEEASDSAREAMRPLARAAIDGYDGGWMLIDGAPREQIIMVFGVWCGEINGRDKEPDIYLAQREGGTWAVVGTDAYSATVDATHWRPIPAPPETLR